MFIFLEDLKMLSRVSGVSPQRVWINKWGDFTVRVFSQRTQVLGVIYIERKEALHKAYKCLPYLKLTIWK